MNIEMCFKNTQAGHFLMTKLNRLSLPPHWPAVPALPSPWHLVPLTRHWAARCWRYHLHCPLQSDLCVWGWTPSNTLADRLCSGQLWQLALKIFDPNQTFEPVLKIMGKKFKIETFFNIYIFIYIFGRITNISPCPVAAAKTRGRVGDHLTPNTYESDTRRDSRGRGWSTVCRWAKPSVPTLTNKFLKSETQAVTITAS